MNDDETYNGASEAQLMERTATSKNQVMKLNEFVFNL
jgi:hypothetical protein